MVQVGGRPILWHIMKIYSHFGFNDFLIAAGYKSEVIKRFFLEYRDQMSDLVLDFRNDSIERIDGRIEPWRVAIIETGSETMTGGRIKRLSRHLEHSTFLMTYGDGVANVNIASLLKFHRQHGKLATFTAVRNPGLFGVPTIEGERVTRFAEKAQAANEWINGGFFVLEPRVLDFIADDDTSFEFNSLNGLAQAGELMAYKHSGFWHPMDTLRDVRKLNSMWSAGEAAWRCWN